MQFLAILHRTFEPTRKQVCISSHLVSFQNLSPLATHSTPALVSARNADFRLLSLAPFPLSLSTLFIIQNTPSIGIPPFIQKTIKLTLLSVKTSSYKEEHFNKLNSMVVLYLILTQKRKQLEKMILGLVLLLLLDYKIEELKLLDPLIGKWSLMH
jgi:hypothetical protein